ncbi:MAG: 50S ribosomal protein L13 [Deltaproteobacteria bacterium]|nr:50S ribosomal protein L13 [Deltaproteobacteria bacterium]RLA88752.1 MAG: 50S ribosomal protein L13 [Deltaproteobacteria bacterium]
MKSYIAKKDEVNREWYLIDAKDQVVGRLASKIATILRGKDKPTYTPHVDTGGFVVVINADKVKLTGKKWQEKKYFRYTGYPGGLREITAEKLLQKKPEELIKHAVKGMLPKNRLGRKLFKKLKVYKGDSHPHTAQQPKAIEV